MTHHLDSQLSEYIAQTNKKQSEVIREALESYLERQNKRLSFYQEAKDFCGVGNGPADLSSHAKHLDGFGQ